jgi:hypothetical protein
LDFCRILSPALNRKVVRRLVLITGSVLLACAQSACASDAREPSEFTWFESDTDIVEGFSQRYTECVKGPSTFELRLGRLAFNSPRLLGGQATRMKLSCASCHPSGRANERFFIEQISSRPGTADISHSFLSSAGGDGISNPKVIPDLVNRSGAHIRDRQTDDFALFMHRLIEVEFDGRKPPQTVFNALLTYLKNTDQAYCSSAESASGLHQRVTLLREALALVKDMINLQVSDEDLRFAVSSTRSQLEYLYEIYGLAPNKKIDQTLIKLSRDLDDILKQQSTKSRSQQFAKATSEIPTLRDLLHKHETTSAFSQSAISAHLELNKKR